MTTLFYPAAIWIDNTPLTDQGRTPVSIVREERKIENELANGNLRKYIKAVKRTFSCEWSWLPDYDEQTLDGGAGRLTLKSLIVDDNGQSHILRIYDRSGGMDEYEVFVESYEESLTRRDPVSGLFLWNASVTFREV